MTELLFILLISPLLKRHTSENLPCALFAKEGKFPLLQREERRD
jgi:hypothetical protein